MWTLTMIHTDIIQDSVCIITRRCNKTSRAGTGQPPALCESIVDLTLCDCATQIMPVFFFARQRAKCDRLI